MAYFAQIDEDGTVLQVISVSNADAPDPAPGNSEPLGQAFIADTLGLLGEWRQTSYNGKMRKNYAGIGFTFDAGRDAFIPPQPFPSWTLVEETCQWTAPTPMPVDDKRYTWDEATLAWVAQ